MITNSIDDKNSRSVISFVDFTKKIKTDTDFQKWFGYLEKNLLSNLEKSKSNVQWNRLIIIAVNLRLFIAFLDHKNKLTNPNPIYYLSDLHSDVKTRVEKEITKSSYSNLIGTKKK